MSSTTVHLEVSNTAHKNKCHGDQRERVEQHVYYVLKSAISKKAVNHCNISMKHNRESTEFVKNTHLKGTVWVFIRQ